MVSPFVNPVYSIERFKKLFATAPIIRAFYSYKNHDEEFIPMRKKRYSSRKRPFKKVDSNKSVEDIVRDIAEKLQNDDNILWFAVESENLESIHNHNAYAYIERDKSTS